jgi:hypothetical protein
MTQSRMFVDLTLEDSESEDQILVSLAVQVELDLCFFVFGSIQIPAHPLVLHLPRFIFLVDDIFTL